MINPFKLEGLRRRSATAHADDADEPRVLGRDLPGNVDLAAELEAILMREPGTADREPPGAFDVLEERSPFAALRAAWHRPGLSARGLAAAGAVVVIGALGAGIMVFAPAGEEETVAAAVVEAEAEAPQDRPEVVAGSLAAGEPAEAPLEYEDTSRTVAEAPAVPDPEGEPDVEVAAEAEPAAEAGPDPEFDLSSLPLTDEEAAAMPAAPAAAAPGEEAANAATEQFDLGTLPLTDEEAEARQEVPAAALAFAPAEPEQPREIVTGAIAPQAARDPGEAPQAEAMDEAVDGAAEPAAPARMAQVTTHVNLRSGPDNASEVLTIVPAGASVGIVACDYWCEVSFEGRQGFIYKDFITGPETVAASGQ